MGPSVADLSPLLVKVEASPSDIKVYDSPTTSQLRLDHVLIVVRKKSFRYRRYLSITSDTRGVPSHSLPGRVWHTRAALSSQRTEPLCLWIMESRHLPLTTTTLRTPRRALPLPARLQNCQLPGCTGKRPVSNSSLGSCNCSGSTVTVVNAPAAISLIARFVINGSFLSSNVRGGSCTNCSHSGSNVR